VSNELPTKPPGLQKGFDALRWSRIICRTLHIMVTSVLCGGHFFGTPADQLRPWLYGTIATGALLLSADFFEAPGYVREVRGVVLLIKLVMIASVALFWQQRSMILFVVIALSGVVSHMPRRLRHRVLFGRAPHR
jgi:hypothetical protein